MKNLLYILPVFIWLQACSQSPAPTSSEAAQSAILANSDAALGDSYDQAFRLFQFKREVNGKTENVLKVVRLADLKEELVAVLPAEGDSTAGKTKFYWSKDSKYLIAENVMADSAKQREVVLFDLKNFSIAQRNLGTLIAFDAVNEVVFYYRSLPERQNVYFYDLQNPVGESVREITVPGIGKLPTIVFSYKEKRARVKAITTDDVPMNIAIQY